MLPCSWLYPQASQSSHSSAVTTCQEESWHVPIPWDAAREHSVHHLVLVRLQHPVPVAWALPAALQHFSESIQEYLANLDKAPDPTVRKDTFSNEIFSAYEVLFNSWLQHREAKVMDGGVLL